MPFCDHTPGQAILIRKHHGVPLHSPSPSPPSRTTLANIDVVVISTTLPLTLMSERKGEKIQRSRLFWCRAVLFRISVGSFESLCPWTLLHPPRSDRHRRGIFVVFCRESWHMRRPNKQAPPGACDDLDYVYSRWTCAAAAAVPS